MIGENHISHQGYVNGTPRSRPRWVKGSSGTLRDVQGLESDFGEVWRWNTGIRYLVSSPLVSRDFGTSELTKASYSLNDIEWKLEMKREKRKEKRGNRK